MPTSPARRLAAGLAALVLLVAAGCGSDDGGGKAKATPTPAGATDTAKKPDVPKPTGPAPRRLVTKDLVVGKGPAAKAGDTVTVQYVGVLYKDGKQFDASWDRGEPFSFPLGAGQVIPGWDTGVVGMKAGGRRELIIPPKDGYGPQGSGPIPPNATLIFVVDLVSIG